MVKKIRFMIQPPRSFDDFSIKEQVYQKTDFDRHGIICLVIFSFAAQSVLSWHIIPSPDFKLKAFCSVIDTMLSENPAGQGILIARRNRDVSQGTGALLSPNDWQLGAGFPSKVVLTMYQVTGRKGWGGKTLWVPNIKLPEDMIYYDITEE